MARKTTDYKNYTPMYGTINRGVAHPWKWKYKDPRDQCMNQVYNQAKAQATFRYKHKLNSGQWKLSFEEYKDIWGDKFEQRGRKVGEFCFTRIDDDADWTLDNCVIVERSEQGQKTGKYNWKKPQRNKDENMA